MISKIQRSRRQFCDVTITVSFQTGRDTTICRRLQGPSQLSTPFYSQLILRIHATMNGLGGGAKTEFAPGRGNPRYATASTMAFFIEGQVIVQLTDFIGQRSFYRFLLVETEAIGVEAEAVDEIAASTSLV